MRQGLFASRAQSKPHQNDTRKRARAHRKRRVLSITCSASRAILASSARACARFASALREASNRRASVAVAVSKAAAATFSASEAAADDADDVEVDDGDFTEVEEEAVEAWDALALLLFGEGGEECEGEEVATGRGRKRGEGEVGLRRPARRRCCC